MSFSVLEEKMLYDIANFYNGKKRPEDNGDIPVYGGNGILDYCNDFNTEGESIIIGRVGAYCGNVNYTNKRCWISDNAILVKAKDKFDSKFIYYNLIYQDLHNLRTGSSQPLLTQGSLKKVQISCPILKEQKAIAHILSTLDEKIEVNNKINKTLENMAKSIFKEWFVDFEFPNEEGEPYKSSGGEMIESELGMLPKGWEVKSLGDVSNITMGQSPSGSSYNEENIGEVFYQGRTDFSFRFPIRRLYTTEPKRMANKDDILMSVRAPVGDINIANENCCIGRGLCAISSKLDIQSYLIYRMFNLKSNLDIYNGEGTVFGSINQKDLKSLKFTISQNNLVEKRFDDLIKSLDLTINNRTVESLRLTEIRDSLLPKLMSGEIRVPF